MSELGLGCRPRAKTTEHSVNAPVGRGCVNALGTRREARGPCGENGQRVRESRDDQDGPRQETAPHTVTTWARPTSSRRSIGTITALTRIIDAVTRAIGFSAGFFVIGRSGNDQVIQVNPMIPRV